MSIIIHFSLTPHFPNGLSNPPTKWKGYKYLISWLESLPSIDKPKREYDSNGEEYYVITSFNLNFEKDIASSLQNSPVSQFLYNSTLERSSHYDGNFTRIYLRINAAIPNEEAGTLRTKSFAYHNIPYRPHTDYSRVRMMSPVFGFDSAQRHDNGENKHPLFHR